MMGEVRRIRACVCVVTKNYVKSKKLRILLIVDLRKLKIQRSHPHEFPGFFLKRD